MFNVSNDRTLRKIQHFQWQSNVFIHTQSHASWREMENGINTTSMTLLTKQWHRRESGAICTPLTDGNFLNILRIRNGNILYFIPNDRYVSSDDFSCIYFAKASVSCVASPFFQPRRQSKMAARFFLQVGHLAKVVLLWTYLLNSVQYQRTFLNSVKFGNLLNVFNNANWTGQFLGYIIIMNMVFQSKINIMKKFSFSSACNLLSLRPVPPVCN